MGAVRYGVIADVHANLTALAVVLGELDAAGVDAYLCAGDLVGYGPHPDACVALVTALPSAYVVVGNHDLAATGELSTERYGMLTRESLAWTRRRLAPPTVSTLASLPRVALAPDGIVLTHGSIDDVEEYVIEPRRALAELRLAQRRAPGTSVVVLGHTHEPIAVGPRRGVLLRGGCGDVTLDSSEPLLINPGSVGQSHARDPRARYAVLDTGEGLVNFRAVPYDMGAVRRDLRRAGLDPSSCHQPHGLVPKADAVMRAARVVGRRVRRATVKFGRQGDGTAARARSPRRPSAPGERARPRPRS